MSKTIKLLPTAEKGQQVKRTSRFTRLVNIFRDAFQNNDSIRNVETREGKAQYFGMASSGDMRWQLASLAAARRNLF
jgi:hypothetical protein